MRGSRKYFLILLFGIILVSITYVEAANGYPDWIKKGTYAKYSGTIYGGGEVEEEVEFISDVYGSKVLVKYYVKEVLGGMTWSNTSILEVDVNTRETNVTIFDPFSGTNKTVYFNLWIELDVDVGDYVNISIWTLKVSSIGDRIKVKAYSYKRQTIRVYGSVYTYSGYSVYWELYYDKDTHLLLYIHTWFEYGSQSVDTLEVELVDTNVPLPPLQISQTELSWSAISMTLGIISVAVVIYMGTLIGAVGYGAIPAYGAGCPREGMEGGGPAVSVDPERASRLSGLKKFGDDILDKLFRFAAKKAIERGSEVREPDSKKVTAFLVVLAAVIGGLLGVYFGFKEIRSFISLIMPSIGVTLGMLGFIVMILLFLGCALGVFRFWKLYVPILLLILTVLELIGLFFSTMTLVNMLGIIAVAIILPLYTVAFLAGIMLFSTVIPTL